MNIHEYQAAEIFARYGIPTSNGTMATTPDEVKAAAASIGGTVVLKSQVHIGGRGKAGGIKLAASPNEARDTSERIFGMDIRGHQVNRIYVVPAAKIVGEYYLGVTLDRGARQITLIASAEGGVEIEEVARTNPGAILRVPVDPVRGLLPYQALGVAFDLNVPGDAAAGFAETARKLVDVYIEEDAALAEINPMARLEDGSWLAADTKMVFDDNALFRHKGIEDLRDMAEENAAELNAKASGISFVQLDGTIGCVVNGAGLAMATMDAVKQAGGDPANFLDVGGGAKADQVAKALGLILADDRVGAVLFNIFGGITRGDEVARGLISGTANLPRRVPIIVRLSGTNAEEGREILEGTEIQAAETMQEAARLAVEAAAVTAPDTAAPTLDTLPTALREAVAGAAWERVVGGRSGIAVYRLIGGSTNELRYLKVAADDDVRAELAAEVARLRWLAGKLPVPHVHAHIEAAGGAFLLLSAVPGREASDAAFAGDPARIVRLLAAGLRMLHALDVRDCPFDRSLDVTLAEAGERVRRGLVDESDFDAERQGRTAADAYAELLTTRPATEGRVFTHGDYSLPNVLFDEDGIGGFIDWSRGGVADRHTDLALAALSLAHNWGAEWVPLLFAEYGIAPVDAAKVAYYQLLDEFF